MSWWSPDLALIGLVLAAASSWRPASSHAVGRGQESALALGAVTAGLMACLSLRDAAAIGLLYLGVGWMVERIGSTWDLADERVCRVTIAIAQTAVVAGEMAFVGTLTPGLLLCGIARVAVTVAVLPLAHRAIRVIFNI
ncbi:MAG: hypothetical protein HYZ92_05620, partial [Candidatus Omnitrophica bacterium]|nr:hypothetical protein [Candidatus Omnitrophota bacterium]